MNILTQYGKEIFAIAVPILTFMLNKYFKSNAKIAFGQLHNFTYLINEPLRDPEGEILRHKQTVHTHSYVFMNQGRESASSVEIIFNYKPMYLNIWPSRHYELKEDEEDRHIMIFDYLAPKESIRCEVLSINNDLPEILSVRCKEGIAEKIRFFPQRVFNPIFINFLRIQIFLGMATFSYLVVIILQWLVVKTG
ncbi:hypothetical protein [Rahnella sp. Larv3_ips]|uniref:hypothetical protein n=1 Tax=Rahnella sp. Larv3_ips TaxID=1896943 RepID=UPI000EFD3D6A|nr:hypothetical protein [Rahnella sp. Larv3_ips]